jgi:hypothetical protein
MQSRDAQIELAVYHNGELVSGMFFHVLRIAEHSEWTVNLQSIKYASRSYIVRGRFAGEIVEDWVGGEIWIFDETNRPISTPRPFLMYLGPSDIPMCTIFPSNGGPIGHAGIWVVTYRAADSMYRLKQKAELSE